MPTPSPEAMHSEPQDILGSGRLTPFGLVARLEAVRGFCSGRFGSGWLVRSGKDGVSRYLVKFRTVAGVTRHGVGNVLVGDKEGTGAARGVVLGGRDEELPEGVELVGLPSGLELA